MTDEEEIDKIQGIPRMTKETARRLSEKQRVDYGEELRSLLKWPLSAGKDPNSLIEYAQSTIYTSANQDQIRDGED